MRKIIHSKFELDLSGLNITDTEQNHWFSDSIFSKYSLPFEIHLSDETAVLFDFLDEYHMDGSETLFEVMYVHNDIMTKAVFEIENIEGDSLSCTIRYGFDEFPNFHKKLSELPLEVLEVDDIYQHAKTVITKSFPEVNYNFPQIHVDKIENPEDDETWFAFENIVNNYKNGEFLENEVDEIEEVIYNRNIIQPLPYLLYVLKTGFDNQGYELKGSFPEHPLVKKMLLYSEKEYFKRNTQDEISLEIFPENEEYVVIENAFIYNSIFQPWNFLYRKYEKEVEIPLKGKYRIIGDVILGRAPVDSQLQGGPTRCDLFYNDELLYTHSYNPNTFPYGDVAKKTVSINIEFDTYVTTETDKIKIVVYTTAKNFLVYEDVFPDTVSSCLINPIFMHNESGEVVPTIINENKVDLPKAVPDMTFGELITTLKNWFNLDFVLNGNEIWINFLDEQINYSDTFDLSNFEVPKPYRGFQKGMSFLLQFQEVESNDYSFSPIFHSHNLIASEGFVKDEKTNEININALPLPLAYRKNVLTAHSFLKDESKPFFVLYGGLVNGLNLTEDNTELLIPNIHQMFWRKWFDFRIRAISFKWNFKCFYEDLIGLKKKVFAYGNYHFIKTINKTEIAPDQFDVEIETEVLK